MTEYHLVVFMEPHEHDNPTKPYFWYIEKDNCNCGFGWARTPKRAFLDGQKYLKEMKDFLEGKK